VGRRGVARAWSDLSGFSTSKGDSNRQGAKNAEIFEIANDHGIHSVL